MARRDYEGGAKPTTITGAIISTDISISIAASTGWPDGSNGEFFVVLDLGLNTEEKILVLSRSGTTLTLASTAKRGVDGTTAQSHASGATIQHCLASPDADEPNAHINDTALDHHTQYLNTTRHDVTARHPAGTVVPTAAPPAAAIGDAAAEGVASTLARSDHKHGFAAPAAPTVIQPDAAAAAGAATTFARSDHTHGIVGDTAGTSTPADTAAEGSSTSFARADHRHARADGYATTAEIADTATAEAAGTSATVARGDHVHKQLGVDAWTSFVPVWTNLTVGNGAVAAYYRQVGKTVEISITITFGTTTSVAGNVSTTVPVASVNRATQGWTGTAAYNDGSATTMYTGICQVGSAGTAMTLYHSVPASNGGIVNATNPMTHATGDQWQFDIVYEAA